MNHLRFSASLVLTVLGLGAPSPGIAAELKFEPKCDLYFEDWKVVRDVDRTCSASGAASATSAHGKQNQRKNEFCAHIGEDGKTKKPIPLDLDDFEALMDEVRERDISYGGYISQTEYRVPQDRSKLQAIYSKNGTRIGEGDLVQFVGYVHRTWYAPSNYGESVNCDENRDDYKDIHLDVTPRPLSSKKAKKLQQKGKCLWKISTEISPHYRPDKWTPGWLREAQDNSNALRITGHLFFDGSHLACPDVHPKEGKVTYRTSSWEIHPVYWVEVCNDQKLQKCLDDEALWIPLHEWADLPWEYLTEHD